MSLDDVELHLIETMDDVGQFHQWLNARDRDFLAFDTEGTGLNSRKDYVRLAQIGDERDGWAMEWRRWSGVFEDTIRKFTGQLVGHNSPFDREFIQNEDVKLEVSRLEDTRPMSHIIDPWFSTALKKQAARYVDPRAGNAQSDLDEALDPKKGGWTWATIPATFQPYWSYAALDTVLTAQLYQHHKPIVDEQAPRAYEVENAVQYITRAMENYGARIDVAYAREHCDKFAAYAKRVEEWCKFEYGIKPGSNVEVVRVLQAAGFTFSKATAGGAVSLDKDVLGGINHPLAQAVLQRRQLQKIASTYLTHYAEEVDADGLIHPSINTLGARTGRMSMSEPNLQNLPRRSENNPAGTIVRNCVIARPGHTLIFCDFSQIEMRMLAWLANDVNMIEAFKTEGDFFVNLARQVYLDNTITKGHPLRDRIKNLGYSKIYGAGVEKQAATAGVPVQQIRETLRAFDSRFTGVATFQNLTIAEALQRKADTGRAYSICPLSGRRHYSDTGKEYTLVNFKIQGGAAILYKSKLIELEQAGLGPWMMIPVHDEIILDVPNEHVPDVVDVLQRTMNDDQVIAPVPVEADVSYGVRWGEKRGWDLERWFDEVKTYEE